MKVMVRYEEVYSREWFVDVPDEFIDAGRDVDEYINEHSDCWADMIDDTELERSELTTVGKSERYDLVYKHYKMPGNFTTLKTYAVLSDGSRRLVDSTDSVHKCRDIEAEAWMIQRNNLDPDMVDIVLPEAVDA